MTDVLGLTPSQTVGPYLAICLFDGPVRPHLVDPADAHAVRIRGVVLDGAGDPVPDGTVEVWQADPDGNYVNPVGVNGFSCFGRSPTVPEGRFELVTLKPGRVPWPQGGLQAPHLVVGVLARGLLKRLVTRMYFPDEVDANATDPVLSRLDDAARQTLVARPEAGGLRFDIVLQGPGQTTFFAV